MGDDVVMIFGGSGVGENGDVAGWAFAAGDTNGPALSDDSGLTDIAGGIGASADFLINIFEGKAAVAAARGSGPHAILRVALDDAIGDAQGVAALPVDSVASALHGDVQVLEPSDGGVNVERSGRVDYGVASGGVTEDAGISIDGPETGVEAVEQEGLVVIDLHVAAEGSVGHADAGGNVQEPRLLCVQFEKWILAICDHGATAWID